MTDGDVSSVCVRRADDLRVFFFGGEGGRRRRRKRGKKEGEMREEGKNGVHRTRAINWNSILKKKNNQHSDHEKQAPAHGNERHGYFIQTSYSFSTGFYFIHKRTFLIPIPARSRTPLALSFSFTSTRCNLLVRGRNPLFESSSSTHGADAACSGVCVFFMLSAWMLAMVSPRAP